jgi:hypothetical protein
MKIPPRKRKTARRSLRRICRKLGLNLTVQQVATGARTVTKEAGQ